ncbi:UPF0223 family protein [Nicoliella lavandulae]|uniref:UPF0223 family protein n=1 Tax=Nicoliella lavandulae TaxID=3082954 RepID=A0ABU8SLL6_9LACO
MKPNYQYPIFEDWNREELTQVCKLYQLVEDAYELPHGANRVGLLDAYADFQKIVPAKGEQRTIERQFESNSGYNIFKVFKLARDSTTKNVKING